MKMPPKHAAGFVDPNENAITVGVVMVPGVGPRVGLAGIGRFWHLSPAGARRMAPDWETATAKAVELDWIAIALREAADQVEAMTATRQ